MQKMIHFLLFLTLFLPAVARAESIEGIVDRMDTVTSSFKDYHGTGVLSPRADGKEIPIGVYVVRSETEYRFKTVIRELQNPYTTMLTYIGKTEDQQWTYSDGMPMAMRMEAQGAYLGSEFSYEDIASLWDVRRFSYTKIAEGHGKCPECVVLSRTPRYSSQYKKQEILVDEKYRIQAIKLFGESGVIKTIIFHDYKRYGEIFLPHFIHIDSGNYQSYINMDEYRVNTDMNERHFQSRMLDNRKWPYR